MWILGALNERYLNWARITIWLLCDHIMGMVMTCTAVFQSRNVWVPCRSRTRHTGRLVSHLIPSVSRKRTTALNCWAPNCIAWRLVRPEIQSKISFLKSKWLARLCHFFWLQIQGLGETIRAGEGFTYALITAWNWIWIRTNLQIAVGQCDQKLLTRGSLANPNHLNERSGEIHLSKIWKIPSSGLCMSPGGQTAVDGVPAKGATHFTSFQAARSSECIRAHFCTRTKTSRSCQCVDFVIFRSFSAPIGVLDISGISQLWASQYCPGAMELQLDMSYLWCACAHGETCNTPSNHFVTCIDGATWNTINTWSLMNRW